MKLGARRRPPMHPQRGCGFEHLRLNVQGVFFRLTTTHLIEEFHYVWKSLRSSNAPQLVRYPFLSVALRGRVRPPKQGHKKIPEAFSQAQQGIALRAGWSGRRDTCSRGSPTSRRTLVKIKLKPRIVPKHQTIHFANHQCISQMVPKVSNSG